MDLTGPKVSQPLVPLVGLQEIEPHPIPLLKVAMDSIKLRYQTPCLMVRLSLYLTGSRRHGKGYHKEVPFDNHLNGLAIVTDRNGETEY